jgi:hypothetical protein
MKVGNNRPDERLTYSKDPPPMSPVDPVRQRITDPEPPISSALALAGRAESSTYCSVPPAISPLSPFHINNLQRSFVLSIVILPVLLSSGLDFNISISKCLNSKATIHLLSRPRVPTMTPTSSMPSSPPTASRPMDSLLMHSSPLLRVCTTRRLLLLRSRTMAQAAAPDVLPLSVVAAPLMPSSKR